MALARTLAALALLAIACQHVLPGVSAQTTWWTPPPRVQWQWQLSDPFVYLNNVIKGPDRVTLYDIDLFDNNAATIASLKSTGVKVMCYFEAGTFVADRVNNPFLSLYPASVKGLPYEAPYTNELWVDVTAPALLDIMRKTLDLAKSKGCDAVEPDNVQGFETDSGYNTGFYKCPKVGGVQTGYTSGCDLDYKEWRGFNLFLANETHARGMAIVLKNNFYMAPEMASIHDMVLSEQCYQYGECGNYTAFVKAGKPVLLTEYRGSNGWPLKTCQFAWTKGFSPMTKSTSLTVTDRKACCGTALASNATCYPLCLAASQDPATCTVTATTGRKLL